MQQYFESVLDLEGNAVPNAEVFVLNQDKSIADIYDSDGNLTKNPLTTGVRGEFTFAAANGNYTLQVIYSGRLFLTLGPITLYDPQSDTDRLSLSNLSGSDGAEKIGYGGSTVADALDSLANGSGGSGGDQYEQRLATVEDKVDTLRSNTGAENIGATSPGGVVYKVVQKLFEDVRTADYPSLAAAVSAASGKILVVNSAIAVNSNFSIPANVSVFVMRSGFFTIASGVSLTVNGDLDAGNYTIFGGSGTVVFSVTSRSRDLPAWHGGLAGAVFNTGRTLYQSETAVGGPVHAYEDNQRLIFTNPKDYNKNAYAGFDANTTASGPGSYEHFVAFQARQVYDGSGEIWIRMDSFVSRPVHIGTGLIAQMTGMRVQRPDGTGPITSYCGIFIEDPASRATSNYAIFAEGGDILTRGDIVSQGLAGKSAAVRVRGNGANGGFGLALSQDASSVGRLWQADNADLAIGVNNSEFMRLKANRRLKMGAPATVLTDNSLVEIQGEGGGAITLKATGGAGTSPALMWNDATTGDALLSNFYTETSPALRGSIDYNRAGGVTRYNTTSDGTLKTVLGDSDAQKSIDILDAIRIRNYVWKDDPTETPQIGPIAQELYEVYPGAVSRGGQYQHEVDGELVEEYKPWAVDKTAAVWHLVVAYQQQKKQIEELTARINELSGKV